MVDPHYANLDLHVFRVSQYAILDFPLIPEPGSSVWVATLWTHPSNPTTWQRTYWEPGLNGRGWYIDPVAHLGDVIEFGCDGATSERWISYVHTADKARLILVGPYGSLLAARADGRQRTRAWSTK